MTDIVDLSQYRAAREQPDADCVRHDEYGRPLYLFSYEFGHADGKIYSFNFWAYDLGDAEAKLASIKSSARIVGQIYATGIPA